MILFIGTRNRQEIEWTKDKMVVDKCKTAGRSFTCSTRRIYMEPCRFSWDLPTDFYSPERLHLNLLAIQWCSVSTVSSNWEVNTAMENVGLNEVTTTGLFPIPKVR